MQYSSFPTHDNISFRSSPSSSPTPLRSYDSDAFSFTHSTANTTARDEESPFVIQSLIDEFIQNTLDSKSHRARRLMKTHSDETVGSVASLLQLPLKVLIEVFSHLDQKSAINGMLACSQLLTPARTRLYRRILIVNDFTEKKALRNERVLPKTILDKSKLIALFDVVRLGDAAIGGYVKELICFADLDWNANGPFTINDSWYLTVPFLLNLETLIWPRLAIVKYQVIPPSIRFHIKTLGIGFSQMKEEDMKSCDNLVLEFPHIEELIISLNDNDDVEQIELLTHLLVTGNVFEHLKSLKISANLTQVISPNNKRDNSRRKFEMPIVPPVFPEYRSFSQPLSPVRQRISSSEIGQVSTPLTTQTPKHRKTFKEKLINNFKSPTAPDFRSEDSSEVAVIGEVSRSLVSKNNAVAGAKLNAPQRNKNAYSTVWSHILSQIGYQAQLKLHTLTLDKIALEEEDMDILFQAVDLSRLKRLELSSVMVNYDEQDDRLESQSSILEALALKLNRIECLALDVVFKCQTCEADCYKHGDFQLRQFLNTINPLKMLHLVTYELDKVKPEHLARHQFSLHSLSISSPERLSTFIYNLNNSLQLVSTFWRQGIDQEPFRSPSSATSYSSIIGNNNKICISSSLRNHFRNTVNHTVLADSVSSPNLFRLSAYNSSKNCVFNEYKYHLLAFVGDQLDDFDELFPRLTEISFFGVKFRTS